MLALHLATTDPRINLAIEETLFTLLPEEHPGFFLLWRNEPSVIVGRHQHTAKEVRVEEAKKRGVHIVRRMTGGGAVYHDLGNLNFSFIQYMPSVRQVDFARFLSPILRALKHTGVPAYLSGRNDIEVDGRKISGSAQSLRAGRVLHHGTLLINTDFSQLSSLLQPDSEKYVSKGVASVQARVANIADYWQQDLSLEDFCCLLKKECSDYEVSLPEEVQTRAEQRVKERYSTWEWNFGLSPAFTEKRARRFPWGRVEIYWNIEKGIIRDSHIYGDFFSVREKEEVERAFIGQSRKPEKLEAWLKTIPLEEWFAGAKPEELIRFFIEL